MANRTLWGDGDSRDFSAFLHQQIQTIPSSIPSSIPPELLQHRVMKSPSLSQKIAFFDQLDALDNVSDGDEALELVGMQRSAQFSEEYNRKLRRKLVNAPRPLPFLRYAMTLNSSAAIRIFLFPLCAVLCTSRSICK